MTSDGPDHGSHAGSEAWHRMLHHTQSDQLSEDTAQTPGMRRYEAISGKRTGSRKIVSGHPVFVFLEDGEERRVETMVLARSTQEGIVVNLPSLRAEVPELDRLIADLVAEGSA
jgi:hypothetical protein